jgi:hypothetical protein
MGLTLLEGEKDLRKREIVAPFESHADVEGIWVG